MTVKRVCALFAFVAVGLSGCGHFDSKMREPGRFAEDLKVEREAPAYTQRDINAFIAGSLENTRIGETNEMVRGDGAYIFHVEPLRTRRFKNGEQYCRVYRFKLIEPGNTASYRGGACRDRKGHWTPADISLESPRRVSW